MYVDYAELGRRVAKRRKELGYRQCTVSEMAEISDKYVSNIERGKAVMSIDTLMKLCDALQTNPNFLLVGSAENKTAKDYERNISLRLVSYDERKLRLSLGFIDWLSAQDI